MYNSYQLLGIPEAIAVTLTIFCFALTLAPYAGGHDYGIFRIPVFKEKSRRRLKWIGPILLFISVSAFVPFWHTQVGQRSRDELIRTQEQHQVGTEIASFERFLRHCASSIADSVAAGQNRASARGFGQGSVAAYEIGRGVRPLRDSIDNRWFELETSVTSTLRSVGVTDTTADPYRRLFELRTRKDSIMAVIGVILSQR